MSRTNLLFVHALSPLHAGTGQSTSAIDLPIARDRATGLPFLPGSSIKGSLRDVARDSGWAPGDLKAVFGPEAALASDHAGMAIFADANLLLLPVRSVAGTFAWIVSPYLIGRLQRDLKEAGVQWHGGAAPTLASVSECGVTTGSDLKIVLGKETAVCFEDLDLRPKAHADATALAAALGKLIFPDDAFWQSQVSKRLCVVHDDVMAFLARHGTQVSARVALEHERKTVRKGGLWYEESLPPETILAGLVAVTPVQRANLAPNVAESKVRGLTERAVQLGGKGTVGRGRCRLVMSPVRQ